MSLVHFVLLGPTFPTWRSPANPQDPFFLCCEWWLSQIPELIAPPRMAALCLVHALISHYNPFLVFICPSEFSTRVHLHEDWCIILPILIAQYWLWEWQGALLKTASKHVYYLGWNRSPAQVGCMRQALGPGALGRPRGSGWRGRWEGGSGWGTHVNPWLFHFNVWQNPLQIKKIKKKKNLWAKSTNEKYRLKPETAALPLTR